jgi:oligopeptide transport system permease protein
VGRIGAPPSAVSPSTAGPEQSPAPFDPGDRLTKFIVRRLIWTIPVILLVILMTFGMMRAIKGNPFRTGERAIPAEIQRNLERKFGLDEPWYVQYANYVKGVFTGDLGPSLVLRNRDVNDIVATHFPKSIELGGLAFLFAMLVGIPLGVLSALKANSIVDYLAMFVSNVGFAIPSFLVATLFIYFFVLEWRLGLPTSGWTTWQSKVLPTVALGLGPMAYFARLVRGTMLETLQQDYIRTARAKGLRWRRVVAVHALRNSLIPAVTAAGPILGFLITGSFIIEQIFAIPGIGRYYVTAVTGRDYSVVMGLTVLLAVIVIFANMVVDVLYGVLDPRTRDARA